MTVKYGVVITGLKQQSSFDFMSLHPSYFYSHVVTFILNLYCNTVHSADTKSSVRQRSTAEFACKERRSAVIHSVHVMNIEQCQAAANLWM